MNADAPLIAIVHESGTDRSFQSLVEQLPQGPEYAVLPVPAGVDGLRSRIDELAPSGRPVILVGHGSAVPVVGAVVLAEPGRFVGAAFVNGTLDLAEVAPVTLIGLPVFHALGEKDLSDPAKVQNATWRWLISESGAPVTAHLDSGGKGPTERTVLELAKWLEHRLARLAEVGSRPAGDAASATWSFGNLPVRSGGGRPLVTWSVPQQQHSDQPDLEFQDQLFERVRALPGVKVEDSRMAVPGARALLVDGAVPEDASRFLDAATGEFAHLHPWYDGSLHVVLPPDLCADAISKGWAQPHMWAGTRFCEGFVLIYGPRNESEVEIVAGIVEASRAHAIG
jgi:phospholipase/carboxylesterase